MAKETQIDPRQNCPVQAAVASDEFLDPHFQNVSHRICLLKDKRQIGQIPALNPQRRFPHFAGECDGTQR